MINSKYKRNYILLLIINGNLPLVLQKLTQIKKNITYELESTGNFNF